MHYRKGERVALEHTDDPHTRLQPGDEGSVVRHDEALNTVDIAWDSGSTLSMCLDAGDRIRRLHPAGSGTTGRPKQGHLMPNHAVPGTVHHGRHTRTAVGAGRADPRWHDCPADADMQYQAPGLVGELWRCRRCQRPWTKVGNCFYEPPEAVCAVQVDR